MGTGALISTPATHHAHHSNSTDDGVCYYKGNFGTAHIWRQYPEAYGITHYEGDEWYAQMLWPIFKSSVEGSEVAPNGPMVRMDNASVVVEGEEAVRFANAEIAASTV